MKEFALVEFLFTDQEYSYQLDKLLELGNDFVLIKNQYEYEDDEDLGGRQIYRRVFGKINTMTASIIKLQNPALAGKMRISYIPEELKDKYRR